MINKAIKSSIDPELLLVAASQASGLVDEEDEEAKEVKETKETKETKKTEEEINKASKLEST